MTLEKKVRAVEKNSQIFAIIGITIAALVILGVVFLDSPEELGESTVSFELPDGQYFNVTCEIADTEAERNQGLMHREDLPLGEGMLFVLDSPQTVTIWMKNTLIPLDIIFIDENNIVTNVEQADVEPAGTPDSELLRYYSERPVKWVVEINQGLAAEYGIEEGTSVIITLSV